jgi:2-polyprenyl-6-methoxyphenol hydroxylase-like FAD-dependent oxidoreductase
VYAIDGRGRRFTDRYGITASLTEAAVGTDVVTVTRVRPDGGSTSSRQAVKDEARIVHWLPRRTFLSLLESRARAEGELITLLTSTEAVRVSRCAAVGGGVGGPGGGEGSGSSGVSTVSPLLEHDEHSSSSGGGKQQQQQEQQELVMPPLRVELRDVCSGGTRIVAPRLLLGADGIGSAVRAALADWERDDHSNTAAAAAAGGGSRSGSGTGTTISAGSGARFHMREMPSLSTGLRFKVSDLNPNQPLECPVSPTPACLCVCVY